MKEAAQASSQEVKARNWLKETFEANPVVEDERLDNLGLFIRRQMWARYLFMHEIYKMALPVHGSILEFGCRWGQNLALFSSFRGIYEPFNHNRKIVGFDSFSGFPTVHGKDGGKPLAQAGNFSTAENYEEALEGILAYHEQESPIPHIRKFELVKGDVTQTLDAYLERHPETVVALAYFDLDLYEPTRHCLERIQPHLVKGSVLGFDELNHAPWPGETIAVRETLGLNSLRLRRLPFAPILSYAVIE